MLVAPRELHPWEGRRFSAGWCSREVLDVVVVRPDVVLEIGADAARDSAGRWRHPLRPHRVRHSCAERCP